jgi:uncharacterized membrane protein
MEDLKKAFIKETKEKRTILISAIIAFIGTFFPWTSVSMQSIFVRMGQYSANGWQYLCILASLCLIALWVLPKAGIKIKLPAKEDFIEKILVLIMLLGPAFWIFSMGFELRFIGYGTYISLIASAIAVYTVFKQKAKARRQK